MPSTVTAKPQLPQGEDHFARFRDGIVGRDLEVQTALGTQKLLYADWTASGRLYEPVERRILEAGKWCGNSHSADSTIGRAMTEAFEHARDVIRRHVNAGEKDALLFVGTGMTGAINRFQHLLGLKDGSVLDPQPVVIVTGMEHHSNQTS